VLVAVLALGAASCSSTDTEGAATTQANVSAEQFSQPDGTAGSEAPEPVEDPEVQGTVQLTDSFRGVTADTITLGYSSIDFERLNSDFGLDLAFTNFGPSADAVAAWYNDNGGVLGRKIELVHETYVPVGPTSATEACLKLTEDATVFAVLGGFNGPGAADVNECVADQHDTVLVAAAPRADQAERAGGRWVSFEMSLDRRNPAFAQLMAETGVLDELGPMLVVGSNPDEIPLVEGMATALTELGTEVPITDVVSTTGDRVATANAVTIWIEQARAAGVSTVVLLGEGEFRNQEFFLQAPEFTYIVGNGDSISDWQSIPPEGLQPGTRVLTNNNGVDTNLFDDPAFAECVEVIEAALGIEVLATSQLPEGEPNYFSGAASTCRSFSLFVQIAEAAGPDLTNDSWVDALDNVPDLSLPGYDFVSINADKVDARDQLVMVEFNLDTLSFDPISDPVNVG
jgi:hypothetical protein